MRLPIASALALTTILFGSRGAAMATMSQDAGTTTPPARDSSLTGRAIPCDQGKIKNFECQNVELLAFLPRSVIGEAAGNDIWGWIDSTTGREFVIIGGAGGTAFVEVTDPLNPKYLGSLALHGGIKPGGAQSVKVYQHYALVGYEGLENGIQIFDLTQLRQVKTPPVVFQETAHYAALNRTHTIAINPETGIAYANGSPACGNGLYMLDVRTPTKPTFAGCFAETIHDAQCVVYRGPDRAYQGREICLASGFSGVTIVDVTDKRAPKKLGVATYPHMAGPHQGWLTEDHRYFFLDDEFDARKSGGGISAFLNPSYDPADRLPTRTLVLDVMKLDDPVLLTEYFHTTYDTDHNLFIRGRYMYQGNNGAGLRIIDVANPKQPKEVGYLTKIGAAWGTYPYLKNDVVAVSTYTGLVLARLMTR